MAPAVAPEGELPWEQDTDFQEGWGSPFSIQSQPHGLWVTCFTDGNAGLAEAERSLGHSLQAVGAEFGRGLSPKPVLLPHSVRP